MVQGLPAVKWTPENNAKLLAAIVCLHPGALDPKKLALVFGANVPTSAITYRLGTLRKEGAGLGLASNGGSQVASKPIKRAAAGGNKATKPRKRRGGMLSDAPSDDESTDLKDDTDTEQEATPPDTDSCDAVPKNPNASSKLQSTISGRITKKRASPRKSAKKDYKALEDPFVAMSGTADGDGNKIFDTENSDSEDTYASDAEFTNGEAQQASIKVEEAV